MQLDKIKLISLVSPCYNEEEGVSVLISELTKVLSQTGIRYEIILVDDGSSDNTWKEIQAAAAKDKSVKGVKLSRNFGQQLAYRAGLEVARGDVIITMDADLQDPPQLIPEMLQKWREGFKIVYAQRRTRTTDAILKRFFAASFYKVIAWLSDIKIPGQVGEFRLMDRRVVEVLLQMKERRPFLRGMVAWVGFPSTVVPYDRPPRLLGETKFPFRKSLQLAIDGITAFSFTPLRVGLRVGFLMLIAAAALTAFILLRWLLGYEIGGYLIALLITFIGGLNLFFVGILGEYITRLFEQTGSRPLYVISEYLNHDE
jgi:glycosyltransferase involved in cell wall biosynthesis